MRVGLLVGLSALLLLAACSPADTGTTGPRPGTTETPITDGQGFLTIVSGEIAVGPRTVSLLGVPYTEGNMHQNEAWWETLEYRMVLRNESDTPLEGLEVRLRPSDAIRKLYDGKDPFAQLGGWRHNYGRLPSSLAPGESLEVVRAIITRPRDSEDVDGRENSLTMDETERLMEVARAAALEVTWDGGSQEFLLQDTDKVAGVATVSRGRAIEVASMEILQSWPELVAGDPLALLMTLEEVQAYNQHLAGELSEEGDLGELVWVVQIGNANPIAQDGEHRYAVTVVHAQTGQRLHHGRYREPALPVDSALGAPSPGPEKPSALTDAVTIGGVTYRAETRIQKSSSTAGVGPVMLRPWVTFTNASDQPVQVLLEGCAVRWRLYQDPSRKGTPAWDSEQQRGGSCMQNPYIVALEPGEWYEVAEGRDASWILNDGLSPGRYYVAIILAVRGKPIELAAGEVELSYGLEGLDFKAEASLEGDNPQMVNVSVTVTNISDQVVRVEYGACALSLRVYENPDRSGVPAAQGGQAGVCFLYLMGKDLAPGESLSPREFQIAVPVADILGDALPEGRYYFTAVVEVNGGSVEAPAGEADLSRDQGKPSPDAVEITCNPAPMPTQDEIDKKLAEITDPAARAAYLRALHRGTGEVVPGFGGMFVDRQDNSIFYVYLLEPDQEMAELAVQKALGILGSREVSEVRPLQGRYSYSQLKEWIDCWDARQPRLSRTTASGISGGDNRISIGVASEADIALAERELEALGIPREAAQIRAIGGIRFGQ